MRMKDLPKERQQVIRLLHLFNSLFSIINSAEIDFKTKSDILNAFWDFEKPFVRFIEEHFL